MSEMVTNPDLIIKPLKDKLAMRNKWISSNKSRTQSLILNSRFNWLLR